MTSILPGGFSKHDLSAPIDSGEWAGWRRWTGNEPFEALAGPFYVRRAPDGAMICAFRVAEKNMNGGRSVHGGALLTFADFALTHLAYDVVRGADAVTVSLNSEFLAGAPVGSLLTARGDVLRSGNNLLFVRGLIEREDGRPIFNFSGIVRLFRSPTPDRTGLPLD